MEAQVVDLVFLLGHRQRTILSTERRPGFGRPTVAGKSSRDWVDVWLCRAGCSLFLSQTFLLASCGLASSFQPDLRPGSEVSSGGVAGLEDLGSKRALRLFFASSLNEQGLLELAELLIPLPHFSVCALMQWLLLESSGARVDAGSVLQGGKLRCPVFLSAGFKTLQLPSLEFLEAGEGAWLVFDLRSQGCYCTEEFSFALWLVVGEAGHGRFGHFLTV